jgi:hypothetical protein
MSEILPFVMWQAGAIQLTSLFGICWTLHAVLDLFGTVVPTMSVVDDVQHLQAKDNDATFQVFRERLRLPVGVRLGLAYGITYWACNYWGMFLTVLVVPSSVWFWNRRLVSQEFWRQLLLAALVAVVMIGPFALMQYSLSRKNDWIGSRTSDMVRNLSAHWRDHTDVPWRNLAPWLEFPVPPRADIWSLGGGGLKTLVCPIGLIAALASYRRRWGAFAVTFGTIAFGLSLGPAIHFASQIPILAGISPYERLQQFLPGFSLIRSPFRFSLFVQLSAVWLSIEALDLMTPKRGTPNVPQDSDNRSRYLPRFMNPLFGLDQEERLTLRRILPLILVSGIFTLEAAPPTTRLYELPSRDGIPLWVQWLHDNDSSGQAVACLPFPMSESVHDYEGTALWMYWGTFHGQTLVNGYSGFFPQFYCDLMSGLEQFQRPVDLQPDDVFTPRFANYASDNAGLKLLNQSAVCYVVMKRSFGTADEVWTYFSPQIRWTHVFSDEGAKVDIYQIRAAAN